ncbi:MAG: AAA family ATPase [Acidobacteriota bacterium]|nr:AAA family ATPase [Acidobacteriota bacterium]
MWIRRVELDGFGDHRDHSLEPLGPNLNVILGANEAGKSTLLEAIRCGLFGFVGNLTNGTARQRVLLELVQEDGSVVVVERRRDGAGDELEVRDEDGMELGGERLRGLLGAVDRRQYSSVYGFALDELQSLGTLSGSAVQDRIVGASLGTASISPQDAMDGLREEAEGLLQPGLGAVSRRVERLQELEEELEELRSRRRQLVAQELELVECEQRIAELHQTLDRLQERVEEGRRWSQLGELAERLREKRREAEALTVPAAVDDDLEERYGYWQDRQERYLEAKERVQKEIAQARAQLGAVSGRPAILDAEEEIRLLDRRAAVAQEHLTQLQRTRQELQELEDSLRGQLSSLGPGWDEARLAVTDFNDADLESLIQLSEDVVQLRRGLGLERMRLSQMLQRQAPRDRRLLVFLSLAGIALVLLGLLGFLAGPDAGLLTTIFSITLAGGLLAWGLRERLPETEAMVTARRQLAEIERALKGQLEPQGSLPMVRQLNKIQGELEAQRAAFGLPVQTTVEEAPRVLRDLRGLRGLCGRRDALVELTASLEETLGEAEHLGAKLAARFGLDAPVRGELAVLAHELQAQLTKARQSALQRGHAERDLEQLEQDLVKVEEMHQRSQQELMELTADLGAGGEKELQKLLDRRQEQRLLLRQAEELEQALEDEALRLGIAGGWPEASRRLERRSGDHRRRQVDEQLRHTQEELETLLEHRGELAERRRHGAFDESYGEALAERSRLRGELAVALQRGLVCSLAATLLERAKGRFEQERQGPVIARASEIFRRITGDRYRRLMVPLGESRLVLERADGHQIAHFETLSRGTREELYLAVRLAFIAETCAKGEALPVLLDDVLVNADPERAARASAVVGELAESTQVVFCTCHPHLARLLENARGHQRIDLEPISVAASP